MDEQKELKSYYKYWGKTARNLDADYHLLVYHSLDVAAVGHVLLKQNPVYLRHFLTLTGLNASQFIPWFTFLLALHDIGKFADSFQNLSPNILNILQHRTSDLEYAERHDSLGWLIWKKYLHQYFIEQKLIRKNASKIRPSPDKSIGIWLAAMVGHHGQPPKSVLKLSPSGYFNIETDFPAASDFVADLIPCSPYLRG